MVNGGYVGGDGGDPGGGSPVSKVGSSGGIVLVVDSVIRHLATFLVADAVTVPGVSLKIRM